MGNARLLAGLFLIAFVVTAPAMAADDPNVILGGDGAIGSDDPNTSGDANDPLATIQEAVWRCNGLVDPNDPNALIATPQSIVYVMPGTYNGFINETPLAGDNVVHTIIKSYDPTSGEAGYNWPNTRINYNRDGATSGGYAILARGWVSNDAGELWGFDVVGPGAGANAALNIGSCLGVMASTGAASQTWIPVVKNCVLRELDYGYYGPDRGYVGIINTLIYKCGVGARMNYLDGSNQDWKYIKNSTIASNGVGVQFDLPNGHSMKFHNVIFWGNAGFDVQATHDRDGTQYVDIINCVLNVNDPDKFDGGQYWVITASGNITSNPQFIGGNESNPYAYQLSDSSPCRPQRSQQPRHRP